MFGPVSSAQGRSKWPAHCPARLPDAHGYEGQGRPTLFLPSERFLNMCGATTIVATPPPPGTIPLLRRKYDRSLPQAADA